MSNFIIVYRLDNGFDITEEKKAYSMSRIEEYAHKNVDGMKRIIDRDGCYQMFDANSITCVSVLRTDGSIE